MSSLFDAAEERPPLAAELAPALRELAAKGVYFGTSSWKYPGWCGSVYTAERYVTRKKFSRTKFDATCLTEYVQTFPTVGGDFSFYKFPGADYWADLMGQVPPEFTFCLKVPENVTVKRWPTHARYGKHAGLENEGFLNPELFTDSFAARLEPYKRHVGVHIFEFGTFAKPDFDDPRQFFDRLDRFFEGLPLGWPYAVEVRNKEYLGPDYFAVLRKHGVAHVFNAWTRMPPISEQIAESAAFTADFTVVRWLLKHGRAYEDAVKRFKPYERIREPDPDTREAVKRIVKRAVNRKERAYALVNNRSEGFAPGTIAEVVASLPKPDRTGKPAAPKVARRV